MNNIKKDLLKEYEKTHQDFHSLLNSISEEDLKKKSLNSGWTNGEILFHMLLGFIILYSLIPLTRIFGKLPKSFSKVFAALLNLSTPLFNWMNALGARGGGTIFNQSKTSKRFNKTYDALIRKLNSINDDEWNKGMHYPTKWDSLFDDYMTLEKLFYFPLKHFKYHLKQINTGSRSV